eukprot:TRINITY_DN23314_c0_g2_i1.p1 TRINITY_DN23314_c0_g2~~TRINITY_DN23314_c0_g2_i1.p1  ORF type:complete len:595 (+),score=56.67 TRINITY_DN23314_c0_g2_i1:100-1884(+)
MISVSGTVARSRGRSVLRKCARRPHAHVFSVSQLQLKIRAVASLQQLGQRADHSWLEHLSPDPDMNEHFPNKSCREVRAGHYVRVAPTPLPGPRLVIYSSEVAELLGISEADVKSEDFAAFFSGDQRRIEALQSWCTPYALAIMGRRMTNNCPFGSGNGYGDGRAISVGEVVVNKKRWEMQLKGAGTTPFCRGFDGRAVLRSSIREFIASEAMHALGIDTTRALSLVISDSEAVRRQWYAGHREAVIVEPCAITTRVATSFLRVGHIDLFSRRATGPDATAASREELKQIVEHALFREYPEISAERPLPERIIVMLETFAERVGAMVSGWLRVGFCQGNFNSDNCLVGGRTMDYGPFGWMDRYDPLFAKWIGSGQHYAFLNQPGAAVANFQTLLVSVAPLLEKGAEPRITELFQECANKIANAAMDTFRLKMGFISPGDEAANSLWKDLEPLMRESSIDYTMFWRQLAVVVEESTHESACKVSPIRCAFYNEPSEPLVQKWDVWLSRWLSAVCSKGDEPLAIASRLRAVNPKYVPREWMLAEAYREASRGKYAMLHELHAMLSRPYDEQPEFEDKYYRRAPVEALEEAGVAYMS